LRLCEHGVAAGFDGAYQLRAIDCRRVEGHLHRVAAQVGHGVLHAGQRRERRLDAPLAVAAGHARDMQQFFLHTYIV